jgi:cell division transport system ATP-binding protein
MSETVVSINQAKIYQGNNLILDDVNFTVQKGEFVYLVGKTGTGKSSLLKTLYGELALQHGTGSVVGFDLKDMDWKKVPFLRRNLGVVFQDFQLLTDRNVHENLRFVLQATGWQDERLIEEKINDVLDKVGLKSKGFKMPFEMSGGEQQRVAIARSLVMAPPIILADEPTGNLDSTTGGEILSFMRMAVDELDQTIVMVTHDPVAAAYADRIVFLADGKVVSEMLEPTAEKVLDRMKSLGN